ncbi:MAG: MFS transporter [candidate division FCPU426 bacterium]
MKTTEPRAKGVGTFAWASFFNDMGSDMIYPIWPVFITSILGANVAVLGLIDGLGNAIVSISQAVSGYWSDRLRKRKVFVWTGYLFGAVSRLGYGLASSWPPIIPLRILDRAGKMRGAPRDAMVADLSNDRNRGRHFGLLRTMDNLGALVGIVICLLLFERLGYRALFMLAAAPSLLSALLILFKTHDPSDGDKVYKGVSFAQLTPNLRWLLAATAIFSLGSFSYSFLLLYAKSFGFRVGTLPLLYLIFTAAGALLSLPCGRLSDRIGRKPVLLLSYLVWVLTASVLLFSHSPVAVVSAFLLYGLHLAGLETVQKAFIAELVPQAFRASLLGGFQMVMGLCAFPASFLAGLLWDRIDPSAPLWWAMGLGLLASLVLLRVTGKPVQPSV